MREVRLLVNCERWKLIKKLPPNVQNGRLKSLLDLPLFLEAVFLFPFAAILMGLPGSGKSTFCDEVMRISRRPWARICQVGLR